MSSRTSTFRQCAEAAIARRMRAKNPPPEPTTAVAACPDSREGISRSRTIWPRGVFQAFQRIEVPKGAPVRLYDDLPPDVVRPAQPVRS